MCVLCRELYPVWQVGLQNFFGNHILFVVLLSVFLTPVTYARLNCWKRFRVSNCTMKVCWPIFGLCSFQDSVINFQLITDQNDFTDLGSFFQHVLWLDLARLLLSHETFSFGSCLVLLFLSCVCPMVALGTLTVTPLVPHLGMGSCATTSCIL